MVVVVLGAEVVVVTVLAVVTVVVRGGEVTVVPVVVVLVGGTMVVVLPTLRDFVVAVDELFDELPLASRTTTTTTAAMATAIPPAIAQPRPPPPRPGPYRPVPGWLARWNGTVARSNRTIVGGRIEAFRHASNTVAPLGRDASSRSDDGAVRAVLYTRRR